MRKTLTQRILGALRSRTVQYAITTQPLDAK